jgi:serine/threonine-protein kinase
MAAISTEAGRGLARHRILVELGQGGMSNVYLAVARGPGDFHKLVVLKVLRADLAHDATFREMALREARIAARLNHPNVVQTYEVLNEGERPVIVMEYLEGQPLSNVLARSTAETFNLPLRLRVLADALAGLHHAHELSDYDGTGFGLVHRDFTPQNVFVGYDGHVKVLDFGIAKTAAAQQDSRTGTLQGKVRYMAPEQIVGSPPLDRRADVYAAGMMLWELVAGSSPWKDEAEITIINRVINGELPKLRSVAPDAPEELERICTKATQFDRDARYATAAEVESALEQVLENLDARILTKDIGRVVTQGFADVRAATKHVIEEQLAKPDRENDPPALLPAPILPFRLSVAARLVGDQRPRKRWIWVGAMFAGVGLASVAAATLGRPRVPPETATPATAPPASATDDPSASPEGERRAAGGSASSSPDPRSPSDPLSSSVPDPAPREVEIRLRAVPASAGLFWDDQRLASNPATITHAADGTVHTVRAEARSFVARRVQIVVDKGADLLLTLDRVPAQTATLATAGASTARTAQTASAPAPDCTPPYYIDSQGIKKFKPRCI